MLSNIIAKWLYWTAQGALPLGRLGARLARLLLIRAQLFDPKLERARGWQCLIESSIARERGDVDEAVRLLRDASEILPDNDAIIANLGITLAMAGRYDESVEVIERAMRGETDITGEPQVWVALVWAYLRSGRAPKALEACERATESQAASLDVRVLKNLALAVCRGLVQRDELRGLLRARPRMAPIVLEFAQHLAHASSHDLARQILRCLPERSQARAFHIIARSALNEGEFNTASWAARELEIRSPSDPAPPTIRSEIALQQREYDAALRHVRRALSCDAHDARALEQLARVQLIRGDWREAVVAARDAVLNKGRDALAGGICALALIEEGALRDAKRLFVVERSGDDLACAYGHAAQALILAMLGNSRDALDLAADAVDQMKGVPEWAATAPVLERFAATINRGLGLIEESGGGDSLEKIERIRAALAETTEPAPDDT